MTLGPVASTISDALSRHARIAARFSAAFVAIVLFAAAQTAPAFAEGDGNWSNDLMKRDGTFSGDTSADRASKTKTSRSARSGRQTYTASARSDDRPSRQPSLSGGGGVRWVASAGCLNGSLRSVINNLASSYGPVTVSSTCRSGSHNRRVGGAPKSMHLSGDAADFRIHSNVSAAYASLRSSGSVGGLKHYGGGLFHIDTGSRRSW